jgi:phage recombination protein Bet
MEREPTAVAVTTDQIELIKRTVAKDATADELKLYLYDCARQGVHPLDKLIHFTKRKGKYTPITSIDFMRTRAADTNEYAGSDVPLFAGKEGVWSSLWRDAEPPIAAMVTVWRLVQGTRCKFEAVARWAEYKPAENDFMWQRMPATMLAKCAEALALRKGFPRQLAGLYAKEEMDQAGPSGGYSVDAPPNVQVSQPIKGVEAVAHAIPTHVAGQGVVDWSATPEPHGAALTRDPNALYIERVETRPTKNANVIKGVIFLSSGEEVTTIKTQLIALAQQLCQDNEPVMVETKKTKWGTDLVSVHRVPYADRDDPAALALAGLDDHGMPIDDDRTPF